MDCPARVIVIPAEFGVWAATTMRTIAKAAAMHAVTAQNRPDFNAFAIWVAFDVDRKLDLRSTCLIAIVPPDAPSFFIDSTRFGKHLPR
jgi:hypothetical protein